MQRSARESPTSETKGFGEPLWCASRHPSPAARMIATGGSHSVCISGPRAFIFARHHTERASTISIARSFRAAATRLVRSRMEENGPRRVPSGLQR